MKAVESFTAEEARAGTMLRALGSPARLRIVLELVRRQECVTSDLSDVLPLAPSTISEHLKVLKEAGIVVGSVENPYCYCLNPEALAFLREFFASICDAAQACHSQSPRGGAEWPSNPTT
ncbi:HTH-type transcriptional repressor SmtB [bacterium HR29]|jgi:tagatose-1,6-bisphosphate aldolase|nr:HTH-type transcriptional repressor SmtB [bacterium HR29]